MRRRNSFTITLVAILALAFFLAVPLVSASAPASPPGFRIHFTQSLNCYLLGWRPEQGIGVYYFQGSLGFGCGPLVF